MEGVSGIVSYEQADPSKSEYETGKRWFMSDLNAVINGLRAGGADGIYVYDEHFYGRNIDISQLDDKNVYLYLGKPPYTKDWAGGLDGSFSGLVLLGFHSKRGTDGALLNHSYEPDIKDIRINGTSVGEIGVEAAIAGDFGVGLALIAADSEGVREAKELLGDVRSVAVKRSLSAEGAECYPIGFTYDRIFEAAKAAAESGSCAGAYSCGPRVVLEVDFFDTPFADKYRSVYGEAVFHGKTVLECWSEYRKNKEEAEKLL